MKILKLSKENQEFLDALPIVGLAEFLPDLFVFEACDFGEWTISDLIELIQKIIKERRKATGRGE